MSTESRRKATMLSAIASLGMAALFAAANANASCKQKIVFGPADAEEDAVSREKQASLEQISVRELNEFHLALLARMVLKLPAELDLSVEYQGIVMDRAKAPVIAEPGGLTLRWGGGQRVVGNIGVPLEWTITNRRDEPLFSFWISVRKTRETVAECRLSKRTLFVNVAGADKNRKEIEKKRDNLGGRSVLNVVEMLKAGASDLEKP